MEEMMKLNFEKCVTCLTMHRINRNVHGDTETHQRGKTKTSCGALWSDMILAVDEDLDMETKKCLSHVDEVFRVNTRVNHQRKKDEFLTVMPGHSNLA